jgi:hypothetical protein
MAAMVVSHFGLCGPVLTGEDYGNAAGEASAGGNHFSVGARPSRAACATRMVGASSIDKNHTGGAPPWLDFHAVIFLG